MDALVQDLVQEPKELELLKNKTWQDCYKPRIYLELKSAFFWFRGKLGQGNHIITIAVIDVVGGLTYKRGERVKSALYRPFRFVCMLFTTKEYLTPDSTAITAIVISLISQSSIFKMFSDHI